MSFAFVCWNCEGLVCDCCTEQHAGHTLYTLDDPTLGKEIEKQLKKVDYLINSRYSEDKEKLQNLEEMEKQVKARELQLREAVAKADQEQKRQMQANIKIIFTYFQKNIQDAKAALTNNLLERKSQLSQLENLISSFYDDDRILILNSALQLRSKTDPSDYSKILKIERVYNLLSDCKWGPDFQLVFNSGLKTIQRFERISTHDNYHQDGIDALTFMTNVHVNLEGVSLCRSKVGGFRVLKVELKMGNSIMSPTIYNHGILEAVSPGTKDELFLLIFNQPILIEKQRAYTIIVKVEGQKTFQGRHARPEVMEKNVTFRFSTPKIEGGQKLNSPGAQGIAAMLYTAA